MPAAPANTRSLGWRFPHPSEDRARREVIGRIDAWWRAFAENADRLAGWVTNQASFDVGAWVQAHLGSVHPLLAWELGPESGNDGRHVFVITPESRRHLSPLVDVVLGRAPELPGWEFRPSRLARPLELVRAAVKARVGVELDDRWRARAWPGGLGAVHVLVSPPGGLFRSTAKDRDVAHVAIEALLGEDVVATWVEKVEVARRGGASPLDQLPASVSALVAAAEAQLPEEPWARRPPSADGTIRGSVVELQPRPAEDYPAQHDLAVGSTQHLELWKAQHLGLSFDDRRFSRAAETFCYLKVDGKEPLEVEDRAEYEDAILEVLEPAGLGCIVGGGTGLRYSYTELALTDVALAVEAMRPVLRAKKLPLRSWLLFWDARLADEWIPIWDEAPPPPI